MSRHKNKILNCIDRVLGYFGENIKYAIYWHLENEFNLRKDEIPDKPEEFIMGLRSIYGSGAYIIEKIIVGEIVEEFKVKEYPDDLIEVIKRVHR